MNKCFNKKLIIPLSLLFMLLAGIGIYFFITHPSTIPSPNNDVSIEKEEFPHKFIIDTYKSINEDYIGQIVFENNELDQPIVKVADGLYRKDGTMYNFYSDSGKFVNPALVNSTACDGLACNGNDVYLRLDWQTMEYDILGSNFLDYRNNLDDQNIILYGHHAYRSYYGDLGAESMQFTKLDYLLDKENYDSYKKFKFILDKEVREYEIALVYIIDVYDNDDMQVYRTDFNKDYYGNEVEENYFDTWYKNAKEKELYPTNIKLNQNDKLLTISTCLENDPTGREIIVAKEVKRTIYK